MIEAVDGSEAVEKSERIGSSLEGDSAGTFEWEERPAKWVFVGVRKCLEIVHPTEQRNEPADGVELTYIGLKFEDEGKLRAFVEGDEVTLTINC